MSAQDDLTECQAERDALAELQPFPVETVMAWKRRVEGAEAIIRYARLLLDPDRQDEPDEENVRRAYEALSGIPFSVDVAERAALSRVESRLARLEEGLRRYDEWASRMPDAGFTSDDPRWGWWHERPYDVARSLLSDEGAA